MPVQFPRDILCHICGKVLSNPQILPCGHRFCRRPCAFFQSDSSKAHLICPVCQQVFENAEMVPCPRLSASVRFFMDKNPNLSVTSCDNCSCPTELVSVCSHCSKYMCEECINNHKSMHSSLLLSRLFCLKARNFSLGSREASHDDGAVLYDAISALSLDAEVALQRAEHCFNTIDTLVKERRAPATLNFNELVTQGISETPVNGSIAKVGEFYGCIAPETLPVLFPSSTSNISKPNSLLIETTEGDTSGDLPLDFSAILDSAFSGQRAVCASTIELEKGILGIPPFKQDPQKFTQKQRLKAETKAAKLAASKTTGSKATTKKAVVSTPCLNFNLCKKERTNLQHIPDSQVKDEFAKFGNIVDFQRPKIFAGIVTYDSVESAKKAFSAPAIETDRFRILCTPRKNTVSTYSPECPQIETPTASNFQPAIIPYLTLQVCKQGSTSNQQQSGATGCVGFESLGAAQTTLSIPEVKIGEAGLKFIPRKTPPISTSQSGAIGLMGAPPGLYLARFPQFRGPSMYPAVFPFLPPHYLSARFPPPPMPLISLPRNRMPRPFF